MLKCYAGSRCCVEIGYCSMALCMLSGCFMLCCKLCLCCPLLQGCKECFSQVWHLNLASSHNLNVKQALNLQQHKEGMEAAAIRSMVVLCTHNLSYQGLCIRCFPVAHSTRPGRQHRRPCTVNECSNPPLIWAEQAIHGVAGNNSAPYTATLDILARITYLLQCNQENAATNLEWKKCPTTPSAHLLDFCMCLAAHEWVQQCQRCPHHQAGLQQQHMLHILPKCTGKGLIRPHTPHAWQQPELVTGVEGHQHQYIGALQQGHANRTLVIAAQYIAWDLAVAPWF
eukprot:GHRR01024107.1.p1 GENE.GHRR01024107.1~~GHRR01024107.1.p1  ORF type:complete len:284 (+),score=47.45 GHRR01024107.1:653-1504(+)